MRSFLFSIERENASWILTSLLICSISRLAIADLGSKCKSCSLLVETFKEGVKRTENQHFAGGNTDWEERKLGKFASSETRLVEIMEYLCKKKHLDDAKAFDGVKEIEFKCHSLVEEHEESVEQWYFHAQNSHPDMFNWLCIDKLRLCCPAQHFGAACSPCPGADNPDTATCFGRGTCHGAGTRAGTGKCKCDRGYVGVMCSTCDGHFVPVQQNASFIECEECDESCEGGCTSTGRRGCRECRSGYSMQDEEGCTDVDECTTPPDAGPVCPLAHEHCVNRPGSYLCVCDHGFNRGDDGECHLDVRVFTPPPDEEQEAEEEEVSRDEL